MIELCPFISSIFPFLGLWSYYHDFLKYLTFHVKTKEVHYVQLNPVTILWTDLFPIPGFLVSFDYFYVL